MDSSAGIRPLDVLFAAAGLLLAVIWTALSLVAIGNETDLFGNGGGINAIAAALGFAGAIATLVVGACCLISSRDRSMWRRRLASATLAFPAWLGITALAVRV